MPNDEYMNALEKSMAQLEANLLKRDILNAEVLRDKETVRVLSSRVQLSSDKEKRVAQLLAMAEFCTPSLKDSIRSVLIRANKSLTAIEVRNALEDSGFNFDDFSNPLSACHATLKRMDSDKEVETGSRDGKTTYRIELIVPPPRVATLASLAGLGESTPSFYDALGSMYGMTVPIADCVPPPKPVERKDKK